MKNKILKSIALCMTFVIVISGISSLSCYAKTVNGPTVSVTVTNINETDLNVDIGFTQNPGVGAMTFTLLYDKNIFATTNAYYSGKYFYKVSGLGGYMCVNHPDSGYISFVWADGGNTDLYYSTGTFLNLKFRISNKVPGKHDFKIANINPTKYADDLSGCFADFDHNKFVPTAKNDTYVIMGDKDNPCIKHSFEFKSKVEPTCESQGYSVYNCPVCGITEKRDIINALGHDFSSEWTVDREAGEGVTKIVSKHCKRCTERTDITYVSGTDDKGNDIIVSPNNTHNEESKPSNNNSNSDKNSGNKTTESSSDKTIDTKDILLIGDSDDKTLSAEQIIDKIQNDDICFIGGVEFPKKIKTFGDLIAKLVVYLFGIGEQKGIFTMIYEAILKAF